MSKPPKKIGDDQIRFDCDCGRIHLFTEEEVNGKSRIRVETIMPPKKEKADENNDSETAERKSDSKPEPEKRKSFFDSIGL